MAACASSSIAVEALCATDKKENFQRLAGLLMCGGVTLLREVFDSIHPPANLPVKLNDPATKMQLKGAKLTKPEWDCVYPSPGMCGKSTDFDITLLFRLLRTICCLTPPATGWDKLPINADHSREADLVRIKYYRNSVYGHNRTMEITDSDFANFWREISEALLRIAGTISAAKRDEWKESINKLLHDPLTPDAGRYVAELQSWYKKDIDTKDEVEKLGNTMEQLMNDKQEQITMLNTKLQELTIKHNQQMNILLEHVISIRTTIESTKPGGSSITQSQFPNTPLVQQPGLQSESACIPGPIPPEKPQTEGAVGTSSSWEFQQNDPTDLDIWQVILSSCNFSLLFEKLKMKFGVDVQSSRLGSLVITVSCSSLKVLKGLWKGHYTGHLNEMVQETLVTAEVLQELCLSEVKLKTIISEKEYNACKELFTQGAVVVPTKSLEKRLVSDTLLHDIGSGLGTSWKELGRYLGIPEKDLKAIDMKEHDKKERKGISMLNMWKEMQGEYATWVVLQEALEEIGRTDLSQKGDTKTKTPHRPALVTKPATRVVSPQMFKAHLMSISNQLTSDDLSKMKFVLQDVLPKMKLEEVEYPYQLFSLMMEAKLLSANNLTRLVELLKVVGRVDLSKYLLMLLEVKVEAKTKLSHRLREAMLPAYVEAKTKLSHRFTEAMFPGYEQTYVKHSEIPKGENYIAESGYVMVINNYIYPSSNLPPRTEEKEAMREFHVTLKYLKHVFQFIFGFRLEQHENLTKSEMLKELTHTAEKDFSTHDCFVCVIQCEGSKDGIFGTDDEVIDPETITSLFTRDKCPSLDGKPKIFLIQALQRQQKYKGPGSGSPPRPVIFQDDFLIWYAPLIHDPTLVFGTPLESLANTLSVRDTSSRDLMEILMGVSKEAEHEFLFRPPYLVSTLTKKVFLKKK